MAGTAARRGSTATAGVSMPASALTGSPVPAPMPGLAKPAASVPGTRKAGVFPLSTYPGPADREGILLSAAAQEFLNALHRRFAPRRKELLNERIWRQRQFDRGHFPGFLASRARRRDSDWKAAPVPRELAETRVILAGAPESEVIRRGLDSSAGIFIADFDNSFARRWEDCLTQHADVQQAIRLERASNKLSHTEAEEPSEGSRIALRPRNWLLEEHHYSVDGTPIAASLFDFGLAFFHNPLIAAGGAPCFSLPKLESRLEAALWRDIFAFSEEHLGIPQGTIRVILSIETLPAAFQMEEMLFELRQYAFAIECSPANYLASYIHSLRAHSQFLLPECNDLSMEQPFLHAYRELLVHTCRKRGAYAIGACDPLLPFYDDLRRKRWARTAVRLNAIYEAEMGFDATAVSDADLVSIAASALAEKTAKSGKPAPEGLRRQCYVSARDLLSRARGQISTPAVKKNVECALSYLAGWLSPEFKHPANHQNLAVAELSHSQLWQWIRYSARLASGHKVDRQLVERSIRDFAAVASRPDGANASSLSAAVGLLLEAFTEDFTPLGLHASACLD